jgi:hypothetical protein
MSMTLLLPSSTTLSVSGTVKCICYRSQSRFLMKQDVLFKFATRVTKLICSHFSNFQFCLTLLLLLLLRHFSFNTVYKFDIS